MASGGKRKGAGRKVGSTNKRRITDYFSEAEITELVEDAKAMAKENPIIMKFLAEQIFGKPKQPLVGGDEDDNPIKLDIILDNIQGDGQKTKK